MQVAQHFNSIRMNQMICRRLFPINVPQFFAVVATTSLMMLAILHTEHLHIIGKDFASQLKICRINFYDLFHTLSMQA